METAPPPPLAGLRVLDLSTVVAGPQCARLLADFGAEVIKVERPEGDGIRRMGWRDPADDASLWSRLVNRNKRCLALDLRRPDDLALLRHLVIGAHVLVENMRPGKLEALGLVPAELIEANPTLVITRVTGFGQDGPYRDRPGFATLAEAMSGYAAMSGEPHGGPLLPPVALTDEVTGLAAAFATMVALHSGRGQVVDVNLIETMLQLLGPLPSAWAQLGYLQPRLGAGIPYSVPRGTYLTADDRWVAVSATSESVAARVMGLLGVADDERFADFDGRATHRDALDRLLGDWIRARPLAEVLHRFGQAQAAAAPVLDVSEMMSDPHVQARGSVTEVDGIAMQGLAARLSETPGQLRWAGPALDAHGAEIRAHGWGEPSPTTPEPGTLHDDA